MCRMRGGSLHRNRHNLAGRMASLHRPVGPDALSQFANRRSTFPLGAHKHFRPLRYSTPGTVLCDRPARDRLRHDHKFAAKLDLLVTRFISLLEPVCAALREPNDEVPVWLTIPVRRGFGRR